MASTYSSDLKLELMATGENAGTWGTKTNTNLNLVQQAVAGYEEISAASADVTLATADTLDLTFAGDGATFTAGKIRVYAVMMDVSDQGDVSADEVDRDALA